MNPNPMANQNPLLLPGEITATLFPPTSRYHGLGTRSLQTSAGREITYLARRFIPDPSRFDVLREHAVVQGERLDSLANQYLGDPEQFWRIADANYEMNPHNLTATAGRRIRITLPEGIPGVALHA